MPAILLHTGAAACYGGVALYWWLTRWRGAALAVAATPPAAWARAVQRVLLLAALLLHALTLMQEIFPSHEMHFGFAAAVSMICWLAASYYWIESLYTRMEGLQLLALPLAAIGVLLPLFFPGQPLMVNATSGLFRLHFLVAMLAYSLFTLAALHAVLMAVAERALHRGRLPTVLIGLPPLLTMEALLFRLIHIAFALLTITLASGIGFSEALFGKPLSFNHKTIFALLSWLIFAVLIMGRYRYGWRGQRALYWTLTGFSALMLAYIGTRFVLEVILGRSV